MLQSSVYTALRMYYITINDLRLCFKIENLFGAQFGELDKCG